MTCPNCGRYAPPDAATGYDADELCPECDREREECAADDAADDKRKLENYIRTSEDLIPPAPWKTDDKPPF